KRGTTRFGAIFDYANRKERLAEIVREMEQPELWEDPARAQSLGRERARLQEVVEPLQKARQRLKDCGELLELASEEDSDDVLGDIDREVSEVERQAEKLEFRRMFSGEMDPSNAFVDIQAGS